MSATDNKYDRQLRLWGKDGQLRLAQGSVCVLGAGPAATETLKNLVSLATSMLTSIRMSCRIRIRSDNCIANTRDNSPFVLSLNTCGRYQVLPGLGSFTVVDGASVSVADLGNNFFVTAADLGRPRAEVMQELHL